MGIFKKYCKGITTRSRFENLYKKLEDTGYDLFIKMVAGEDISRDISRYRRNLDRVDSLYRKWNN